VSLVDAAMPGMLPVINEFCVEQAVRTGLGLKAQINKRSVFDRKNYFYPDQAKNYQISQYDEPLCVGGQLDIARYTAQQADARSVFEANLSQFQAQVAVIQLAIQVARQEAEQTARQATDVALQNEARTLDAALGEYQSKVSRYQVEVASYGQQAQAAQGERTVIEQIRANKLQMYARDRARVQQSYEEARRRFERAFIRRRPISVEEVKEKMATGYTSCCNPQHLRSRRTVPQTGLRRTWQGH
jgi:hypothetical protein